MRYQLDSFGLCQRVRFFAVPDYSIMRFYEVNCPTYAMTETKRLGPKKDDQAARRAVEEAMSEEGRHTDVNPHAVARGAT
jgi:hypothetical protein